MRLVSEKPKQEYNPREILVFLASLSDGCFVWTSLENGWPFLDHLVEINGLSAISVRYEFDRISELVLWQKGQRLRVLQALNDDPWVWYAEGDPLPFEDVSHYSRRRIRDRLPEALVDEYLEKLGLEVTLKDAEQLNRGGI